MPLIDRLLSNGYLLGRSIMTQAFARPIATRSIAVVTGATSGMGRALVEELCELAVGQALRGIETGTARVVYPEMVYAASRGAPPLAWKELAHTIRFHHANVRVPQSIHQLTRYIAHDVERVLGITASEVDEIVLVNQAGVSDAPWEVIYETNVQGILRMVEALRKSFPYARIRNVWPTSIFETENQAFGNILYYKGKKLLTEQAAEVATRLGGVENVRVSFGPVAWTKVFDSTPTPGMMLLRTIQDRERNPALWTRFAHHLTGPFQPEKETTIHYLEAMLRNQETRFSEAFEGTLAIVKRKDPHLYNPKYFEAVASSIRRGGKKIIGRRGKYIYEDEIISSTQHAALRMLIEGDCNTPARIAGEQMALAIRDQLTRPQAPDLYKFYSPNAKYLLNSLKEYLEGAVYS